MPSGHTDKSTINKRRPLSQPMRDHLLAMVQLGGAIDDDHDTRFSNTMRALKNRGLVEYMHKRGRYGRNSWHITETGRAAAIN